MQPNHKSATLHVGIIEANIQSELRKGRIKQLPHLPSHYFCSPLGLVPKNVNGVQADWRTIFNLSSPESSSVNDGIPKEFGAISYESLAVAINLIAEAGPGAMLMKRDLKSAFRHVPVSPLDHWLLIFEWDGKFYVDMFLPFGLRTAPRIFNLFAEALHWIFEELVKWKVTHYLDDFLFVFPPGTDVREPSRQYDDVLATMGFSGAAEKNMDGHVITHLGFEFDTLKMEVRLPAHKKLRAFQATQALIKANTVSVTLLEETLGFLSHCCQVVPLGKPFLRNLFPLLHRSHNKSNQHIRIPKLAKQDLRWWLKFLAGWSAVSTIQPTRHNHDVATDASGLQGIGGIYNRQLFAQRIPARHRSKHINYKEMFAILHAFILWHRCWTTGRVRIACDNTAVVDGITKRSIKGPAIRPLQTILLIAALFDIEILIFWIPSEENIVADAASRHNFRKLANLGFQDQIHALQRPPSELKMATLRQKLYSSFKMPSPHQPSEGTTQYNSHTNSNVSQMDTIPNIPHQLKRSHTGSQKLCIKSNPRRPKHISRHSDQSTIRVIMTQARSTIHELNSFSVEQSVSMGKGNAESVSRSQPTSWSALYNTFHKLLTDSTSKRRSVWRLPDSYDLVNLHGMFGTQRCHGEVK